MMPDPLPCPGKPDVRTDRPMLLVYVAGPYRSPTEDGLYQNINLAREHAKRLWSAGYAVICPHMNSAFMGGCAPDERFLRGDIEILKRCDAIYLLPGWKKSYGAREEWKVALRYGLKVMEGCHVKDFINGELEEKREKKELNNAD